VSVGATSVPFKRCIPDFFPEPGCLTPRPLRGTGVCLPWSDFFAVGPAIELSVVLRNFRVAVVRPLAPSFTDPLLEAAFLAARGLRVPASVLLWLRLLVDGVASRSTNRDLGASIPVRCSLRLDCRFRVGLGLRVLA